MISNRQPSRGGGGGSSSAGGVTISSSGSGSGLRRQQQQQQRFVTSGTTTSKFAILAVSVVYGVLCFYFGLLVGSSAATAAAAASTNNDKNCFSEWQVQERIQQERQRISAQHTAAAASLAAVGVITTADTNASTGSAAEGKVSAVQLPPSVRSIATGIARVPRDAFAAAFKGIKGLPLDPTTPDNAEVVIVYNQPTSLPHRSVMQKALESSSSSSSSVTSQQSTVVLPLIESVEDATANCDVMTVQLVDHSRLGSRSQCTVLFGQYESFHLQKYMRLPPEDQKKGPLDKSLPLRFVARGAQINGRMSQKPPSVTDAKTYWDILFTYLQTLESVLDTLRPIATPIAEAHNNTIIVLVCNFGQSELLLNFICSAQSRHLDVSAILVFATDEETRDLCIGMGIHVFYDKTNYGFLPKEAAKRYADRTFRAMMLAKVFCVQMISFLGHNLLFQDVDVIWYRNPLEYFHDPNNPDGGYDMYFQDDGNHAEFYAPYSANTGFYYIRSNDKTRHFFNSLLMAGDLIIQTKSHQVALIAMLNEHVSLYGVTVKIFHRDGDDFPGGHAFNRRRSFMKDFFDHKVHPWIFHMSWTLNKANKIKYYQQMGEWMLQETCVQKPIKDILGDNSDSGKTTRRAKKTTAKSLVQSCCAAKPIVTCHYKDKPSIVPCKKSPPIDKGRPSFW